MPYPKTDEFFTQCMQSLTYDESNAVFMRRQFNKDGSVSWLEPAGVRTVYGIRLKVGNHVLLAHHLVWRMFHGVWSNHHIKHKDNDVANNRIDNLHIPGERRKPKTKPEIVTFLNALGVSDRQIKRMTIEKIRNSQGEKAAIDAELMFGMISKDNHAQLVSNLAHRTE